MPYRVHLDSFEGPLDLLLHLIKKYEVDVYDIPIHRITASYIAHLETLQEINVNVAGEFLVMASKLMEIKSKLLLPGREIDGEEEEEDPRMELVRQLLEYRKYKEASLNLEERRAGQLERYPRGSDEILELAGLEDAPIEVDLWSLLEAFQKVLNETSARRDRRIIYDETPIAEYIARIRGRFAHSRRIRFGELFAADGDRGELIGLFLALLELVKMREVLLTQEELFGEIHIEVVPDPEPEEEKTPNSAEKRESVALSGPDSRDGGGDPGDQTVDKGSSHPYSL